MGSTAPLPVFLLDKYVQRNWARLHLAAHAHLKKYSPNGPLQGALHNAT